MCVRACLYVCPSVCVPARVYVCVFVWVLRIKIHVRDVIALECLSRAWVQLLVKAELGSMTLYLS